MKDKISALLLCLLAAIALPCDASDVVKMVEACSVGHISGGPAPLITTLLFYENGDVEYSVTSNVKYRVSVQRSEVASICTNVVAPLAEATAELEPELENQHDTERFWVRAGDRIANYPRRKFREVEVPGGNPPLDVKEEDLLSDRVKQLMRDLDERGRALFGKRYEYGLLRN